jgi:nitrogen fixation protein NifB
MYPNQGTPFAEVPEPSLEFMSKLRSSVEEIIPQMKHCTRCRADAVGLLDNDRTTEFRTCLSDCSQTYPIRSEGKPYVAVATMEGMLVNLHLGEATHFQIWGYSEDGFSLIDTRKAPEKGSGINRWYALAGILADCRAVLVSGVGEIPRQALEENHILPVEMSGFIQTGLEAIYNGRNPNILKARRNGCAKGGGCSGNASGCG